jgi:DNA-directed RNA polymerase specialized sigma24 family protein
MAIAVGIRSSIRSAPEPDEVEPDRATTLVCRIASCAGISRRRAMRICRQLHREGLLPRGALSRAVRNDLVAALRAVLNSRVDGKLLRRAVADAVLLDEFETLPASQQEILHAVHGRQLSVHDAAAALGFAPEQAAVLLRDAEQTLAMYATW